MIKELQAAFIAWIKLLLLFGTAMLVVIFLYQVVNIVHKISNIIKEKLDKRNKKG